MSQPQLNSRLTSLDATFLYFERKEAALHIGSINIYEGEIPFDAFVENMVAKLPMLPRYRQKVVPAPFNLGHPTWEFDQNFNIHRHIFKLQLAAPGTMEQLHDLAEQIMPTMLDRDKPLWELHMVYGLEGGKCAMLAKVHHAMIDGISGIDLLKIILDISPNPPPPPKAATSLPVSPKSDPTRDLMETILTSAEEGTKSWLDFQRGLLGMAQSFFREPPQEVAQRLTSLSPAMTTPPPLFSFNRPPSGKQKLVWQDFYFAEARAVRAALGGTVNDVILTALTGAISRYLVARGQSVAGRQLRIMVPVSMRQENQRGALGNLVSVLPVEIPLDLTDPKERLGYVSKHTGTLKTARTAETLNLFTSLLGMVPASLQALMGTLAYTALPVFNIVCTNVPGPQIPLYSQGQRMVAYYPYVPVAYAVGLSCAIVSYDQKLYFGITLDGAAEPDPAPLRQYLQESFAEMRQAAGVTVASAKVVEEAASAGTRRSRPRKKTAVEAS